MSSISQSENYLKVIGLFEKNSDRLSYADTDGEIQGLGEWDYLSSKILVDSEQALESALAFNNIFIEIGNIMLKYQDTD